MLDLARLSELKILLTETNKTAFSVNKDWIDAGHRGTQRLLTHSLPVLEKTGLSVINLNCDKNIALFEPDVQIRARGMLHCQE